MVRGAISNQSARAHNNHQCIRVLIAVLYVCTADNTLSSLLAALGFEVDQKPPYASSLLFEVWEPREGSKAEIDAGRAVRIVYNDQILLLDGCDAQIADTCPLKDFIKYCATIRAIEHEAIACRASAVTTENHTHL
jgi:hypothetical protein